MVYIDRAPYSSNLAKSPNQSYLSICKNIQTKTSTSTSKPLDKATFVVLRHPVLYLPNCIIHHQTLANTSYLTAFVSKRTIRAFASSVIMVIYVKWPD